MKFFPEPMVMSCYYLPKLSQTSMMHPVRARGHRCVIHWRPVCPRRTRWKLQSDSWRCRWI